MASAVLVNQSESNWPPQSKSSVSKFMGKVPYKATEPNPNAKFNKKRQFRHQSMPPDDVAGFVVEDSPAVTQSAASDDASSINRKLHNINSGACVSFRISSYSRKELIDLKNQLIAKLKQIRELKNRIESHDFHRSSSNKKPLSKKNISGNKRPLPPNFNKELKRLTPQENRKASTAHLMKNCSQILNKLMKHKHGHIFNSPVDVVGLGLHDYFDVIKNPMDLGSVKSRMAKNFYGSPLDFAADVRLTFNNAMLYNPKGHEVHVLAEQLLTKFEELFQPLSLKLEEQEEPQGRVCYEEELQASSWDHGEADRLKNDRGRDGERIIVDGDDSISIVARNDKIGGASGLVSNPKVAPPQMQLQAPARVTSSARTQPVKPLKQPKPKAKDPNKREMTMEEKQKLGIGLQSLPQEKMDNVVQIIRKKNGQLRQDGDEIELDIEAMDTETLWELDRFVTNYKKMVSKIKRQALMTNNVVSNNSKRKLQVEITVEKIDVPMEMKKPKKGDAGEEDVDIGDEMPISSFPPVEIEKDNDRASSSSSGSSSSGSGSSSSSDSESGSSSGSDSDADDARS